MSVSAHICASFELPDMIVKAYLEDLTDDELLIRPREGMNHIAWQLGHLIQSENFHISQVCPDSMPELPADFVSAHSKDNASSDDRTLFLPKTEYIRFMEQQREGTIANLKRLSEEDLMTAAPETIRYFGPTVGAVFAGETAHWMMHAGQWAVVRRKLGKPPLF